MKLVIEVTVPFQTIAEVQEFVRIEDAFDCGELDDAIAQEHVNAVDAFMALYMSGKVDYTVTKAEMHDDGKEVIDSEGNAHWEDR
jgi:hypothetical protein